MIYTHDQSIDAHNMQIANVTISYYFLVYYFDPYEYKCMMWHCIILQFQLEVWSQGVFEVPLIMRHHTNCIKREHLYLHVPTYFPVKEMVYISSHHPPQKKNSFQVVIVTIIATVHKKVTYSESEKHHRCRQKS